MKMPPAATGAMPEKEVITMNMYTSQNFAVKNMYHDTAKAFLIGLGVKFETSEMGNNECCFALYDLQSDEACKAMDFLEQECDAVPLPF